MKKYDFQYVPIGAARIAAVRGQIGTVRIAGTCAIHLVLHDTRMLALLGLAEMTER